mmetsp:Transcript_6373/g.6588  ORF Transcript_6373/g.6588 Transcript_6373/m.6588 type:complete len:311 (-) Transcript_6373:146-1078(-)
MTHDQMGYLTVCPSRVGSGVIVSITLKLRMICAREKSLRRLCEKLNLSYKIVTERDTQSEREEEKEELERESKKEKDEVVGTLINLSGDNDVKPSYQFVRVSTRVSWCDSMRSVLQAYLSSVNELVSIERVLEEGGDWRDVTGETKHRTSSISSSATTVASLSLSLASSLSSSRPVRSLGETERNLMTRLGVTRSNIFTGEMVSKKLSVETTYKHRLIWIDASDGSFHWAKIGLKDGKPKGVRVSDMVGVSGPSSQVGRLSMFASKVDIISWSIGLRDGSSINIQMQPGSDSLLAANDWVKVLRDRIKEE